MLSVAIRERVRDAGRRRDERARRQAQPFVADEEVDFAFQDVERVDVVVVRMRVGALEPGVQLELDQRQFLASDLDRRHPVVRGELLALARPPEHCLRRGLAAPGWRVDAVEPAFLTVVPGAQVVGEASVRRVEVEEDGARRRAEAVHDLRRRASERTRVEQLLLVVHEHGHTALEHVERVRVAAVVVRARALACVGEVRLRDRELLEPRLEHDAPAEERLALPGPEHDGVHCGRV